MPTKLTLMDKSLSQRHDIEKLFALLRSSTGLDFSDYKLPMVLKRIEGRMRLHQHGDLPTYLHRLETVSEEAAALSADLLIGVTSFFRDPTAFEDLQRTVLPRLAEACLRGSMARIWVAGCATGQEAYSIAISLLECVSEGLPRNSAQIFATDALKPAISVARAGIYPASTEQGLSPQRLERFFVKLGDGYQVAPQVRELCVFAHHNLIDDTPFSQLDLITCRNVLICLKPRAQERVLTTFHRTLKPGGTLMLGRSESVNRESPLFARSGDNTQTYTPRAAKDLVQTAAVLNRRDPTHRSLDRTALAHAPMPYDVVKEADRVLLTRFVCAAILVDPELKVLLFRGQTGPLMGPLSGAASLDVLKLVDQALWPAVRHGLNTVQKTKRLYRRQGLLLHLKGQAQELDLEIVPLRPPKSDAVYCLIVLAQGTQNRKSKPVGSRRRSDAILIKQLRGALVMTQQHLQTSMVEHESANESLRATLEELQSTNEELQVTNEELETGKDELQSSNEALALAHGDLQLRNAELKQLVHDQLHLFEAATIAAALFGHDLRLRRVTALAASLLQIRPLDIGRPLAELRLGLQGCDLAGLMTSVLRERGGCRTEVSIHGARQYALELRVYHTVDGSVDGVVMTLNDITALRITEDALRRAEQRISSLKPDGVSN